MSWAFKKLPQKYLILTPRVSYKSVSHTSLLQRCQERVCFRTRSARTECLTRLPLQKCRTKPTHKQCLLNLWVTPKHHVSFQALVCIPVGSGVSQSRQTTMRIVLRCESVLSVETVSNPKLFEVFEFEFGRFWVISNPPSPWIGQLTLWRCMRCLEVHEGDKLAHYARACTDIVFRPSKVKEFVWSIGRIGFHWFHWVFFVDVCKDHLFHFSSHAVPIPLSWVVRQQLWFGWCQMPNQVRSAVQYRDLFWFLVWNHCFSLFAFFLLSFFYV